MRTEERLTCRCKHCSGEIVFGPSEINTKIPCPLCDKDTVLYWSESQEEFGQNRKQGSTGNFGPLLIAIFVGVLLAIISISAMPRLPKAVLDVIGEGVVSMALFAVVTVIALLWLFFPLFVYFSLVKIRKEMIRSNSQLEKSCDLLKRLEVAMQNIVVVGNVRR